MKNYYYAMAMWIKNKSKWEAVECFCKANDIKFIKMTEKDIFVRD